MCSLRLPDENTKMTEIREMSVLPLGLSSIIYGERGDAHEPEVLSSSAVMTMMGYPSRKGLRNLSRTELPFYHQHSTDCAFTMSTSMYTKEDNQSRYNKVVHIDNQDCNLKHVGVIIGNINHRSIEI